MSVFNSIRVPNIKYICDKLLFNFNLNELIKKNMKLSIVLTKIYLLFIMLQMK